MIYIGFSKNKGLASSLIRWQTRSQYDHAALVYDLGSARATMYHASRSMNVIRVIEAVPDAGVITRWWNPVTDFGHYTLYGVHGSYNKEAVLDFARNQVGKEYDLGMVMRFLSRRTQEGLESSGKWFSSELVYAAFYYANFPLLRDTQPWEVSPGLLARSPFLHKATL